MRRTRPLLAVLLALAATALAPSSAVGTSQIVTDCASGRLTHTYSVTALRNALATLPTDVKEYTSCADVITKQLLKQLGRSAGPDSSSNPTGGSSGSFLPTWVIVLVVVVVLAGGGAVLAARIRGPQDTAP